MTKREKTVYVAYLFLSTFNVLTIVSFFFFSSLRPTIFSISTTAMQVEGVRPYYSVEIEYSGNKKIEGLDAVDEKKVSFWPSYGDVTNINVVDENGTLVGEKSCIVEKKSSRFYGYVPVLITQKEWGKAAVSVECDIAGLIAHK